MSSNTTVYPIRFMPNPEIMSGITPPTYKSWRISPFLAPISELPLLPSSVSIETNGGDANLHLEIPTGKRIWAAESFLVPIKPTEGSILPPSGAYADLYHILLYLVYFWEL
ncbi:hypothetical protein XELAEV_18028588mg [Xenopus laevis]|uniref:Uncharacterized protein n=1 Tax=Xenopus laevis TaxID=8355 RepID=A0A974CRP5_XENLA|nr:hypothetical protein XELAEV_18028588mg [Xenopus laevis]